MLIVDSSVWISYFNGTVDPHTERLNNVLGQQEIGLTDIILCEVLQGFRTDRDFERARTALLTFPILALGGQSLAIKSAVNYRTLRQHGITVRKTVDCLIATFVIEQGYILLHNERDFDPFAAHLGLQVADVRGE